MRSSYDFTAILRSFCDSLCTSRIDALVTYNIYSDIQSFHSLQFLVLRPLLLSAYIDGRRVSSLPLLHPSIPRAVLSIPYHVLCILLPLDAPSFSFLLPFSSAYIYSASLSCRLRLCIRYSSSRIRSLFRFGFT